MLFRSNVTQRTSDSPHVCFHRPELEQIRFAVVLSHLGDDSEIGSNGNAVRRVVGGEMEIVVVDVGELEVRSHRTVRIVIPRVKKFLIKSVARNSTDNLVEYVQLNGKKIEGFEVPFEAFRENGKMTFFR